MSVEIIVGLQWGDEGKGKIIDILAQLPSHVIRAQGGNNAGHTVIDRTKEYKFHQIPSGILSEQNFCYIGAGTVVSPLELIEEVIGLEKQGIVFEDRFYISPCAHVIFPFHQALDCKYEENKKNQTLGTTKKGIGPCYMDKAARIGIRMGDLVDEEIFRKKLDEILFLKKDELNLLDFQNWFEKIFPSYVNAGKKLKPFIKSFELELHKLILKHDRILIEGAQGAFLDLNFGTYPFVTSSNTLSASLCLGAGISPNFVTKITGVVKAYTTRVGQGPMPTEIPDDQVKLLLDHGLARERGTTTGRDRRIGWFDAVLVKTAAIMNGVDSLALTKIDILDSFKEIYLCVGYLIDGKYHTEIGYIQNWAVIEPVYEKMEGWVTSTKGIRVWKNLPDPAKRYISRIEEIINVPVKFISTGPKREDTIFL